MISIKQLRSKQNSQAGVTLVELLIYMGLFMSFLLLLSGLLVSILDVQRESVETARIEEDSQFLYSRLKYDISRAKNITVPTLNGEISQTLTLTSPENIEISYSFENEQLVISQDAQPEQNLNHPQLIVTDGEFQRLGNEEGQFSIRVSMTLRNNVETDSVPEERELDYTFTTRQFSSEI